MFTYERNINGRYSIYDERGLFVGHVHTEAVAEQFCRHLNERDKAQAEFAEWWRAAS